MSDYRVLEALATAVAEVDLWPDGAVLAEAIALRDRLDAKIMSAYGDFDAEGRWACEGASSGTAWLRSHCEMTSRRAARMASQAKRLRSLPVCSAAAVDGSLSGGQVEAIVAVLDHATTALFAEHEAELVPRLRDLTVKGVARAMATWKARAAALLPDPPEPAEPTRSLHLSATLGGRYEASGSFDPEGGTVIATALGLAATDDAEGDAVRSPAARRGDALVDVCRFFLDHRTATPRARNRPHLNVVVDLDDLLAATDDGAGGGGGGGGGGQVIGGPHLDPATLARLACDSVVHRAVFSGRSALLDYGRSTRTIPAALWNALVVRDEHCRFPGCDRPPDWCEAHHLIWFSQGGSTSIDNLVLGCSRHHHVLHLPGWHAKLRPDGVLEVTDPEGRVRTTAPPRAGPSLW